MRKSIHGTARAAMTIAVGDELPDATLSYFDSENNMQVSSHSILCIDVLLLNPYVRRFLNTSLMW